MTSPLTHLNEKAGLAPHHYKRNPATQVEPDPGVRTVSAWRQAAAVGAFYTVAVIWFTWPLGIQLGTHMISHIDPPFSAWRLSWVSWQLTQGAPALFDTNIFWPAKRTLAYSDAMLVQGALAVPLNAIGLSAVTIANLLTLGAMAACGASAWLLARRLIGHTGAALLAGVVFAFAPGRIDHIAHLELQWAFWMPLAFWAWHRTLDYGRFVDGLVCVLFVVLQLLSSIYYGIFLGMTLAVLALATLIARRFRIAVPALVGLGAGAVLLGLVAAEYARPYKVVERHLGARNTDEVRRYSATPGSFLSTRPENWLYGSLTGEWQEEEKHLNPGVTPVAFGVAALVPPLAPGVLVYAATLAFSADAALGLNGQLYPRLRRIVTPLRGLRAPARFGALVQLCLGVLAGFGLARLARRWPRYDLALTVLSLTLTTVEYSSRPFLLMSVPVKPPPIYRWLSLQLPNTVTLELPVPMTNRMPGFDPFYTYYSIWHRQPLVNGYSGHYYPPYMELLEAMKTFPSDAADRAMARAGVKLVVVHQAFLPKGEYEPLVAQLDVRPRFRLVNISDDAVGEARAYFFTPNAPNGQGVEWGRDPSGAPAPRQGPRSN
jgi:hypothetical protein